MAENRKKVTKQSFDVHRTLPSAHGRPQVHPPRRSAPGHRQLVSQQPLKPSEQGLPKKRRSIWKLLSLFLLLIFLTSLAFSIFIIAWDQRNISAGTQKMFGSTNLLAAARGGPLKTDSNGRVNVLVVGYSVDDPGHQGAKLTDSLLFLSMNPANHTGYILSIPRDLYVSIPGFGYGKINEVYQDGGTNLLEQVLDKDMGVNINYYAIIDYSAVKDIVNSLGGINVSINSPDGKLYDPSRDWSTGGPLVDLSNGTHSLNGEQALDLTRARGDPSIYGEPVGFEQSDFQRTADQRLVFSAIKTKLNWKLLLDPRKNKEILNAIAFNVKTDIQINEVRALFGLFNSIPNAKLKSISLNNYHGQNLLQGYTTYYGQDALVPTAGPTNYDQIQQTIRLLNSQ